MSDSEYSEYSDEGSYFSDEGSENSEDEDERKKKEFEHSLKTRLVQFFAFLGVAFSLTALGLDFKNNYESPADINYLLCVFAGLTLICGLFVMWYQGELGDGGLRDVINELRETTNELMDENDKLSENNDDLERQLKPLKKAEKKLQAIAKKMGISVNKMMNLIQENERCMNDTQKLLKMEIIQRLIEIVFDVDGDWSGDGILSDKEIRRLLIDFKNEPTILIKAKKFEAKVKKSRKVKDLTNMIVDELNSEYHKNRLIIINDEVAQKSLDNEKGKGKKKKKK